MLDAALDYVSRGVPVFPVWGVRDGRCGCGRAACTNIGKHPLGTLVPSGLKDATTDPDTIRRWWTQRPDANLATPTTWSSVVDIDPRHGGDVSLARLEREHGAVPETAEVLTGGGGRHLYFQPVPGLGPSAGKVAPGIDVKSGPGAYVLLPPSSHLSGGTYLDEVCHPLLETPLAVMPPWLLALAASETTSAPPLAAELEESVAEGKRNVTLTSYAGSMRRCGMQTTEITAALLEMNRRRCQPPLPDGEVRVIAASISRYAPAGAGVEPSTAAAEGRFLTVAQAQARLGATVDWVVDGLLAVGDMSVLLSKPGVGKSALARQLARAVSAGQPFLGRATNQGQVLYLALEGARATLAHLVKLGHDPASDQILVYIDDVNGHDPVAWLRRHLATLTPALIIVDCLFDFTRISDSANNAGYGAIYAALGPVLRFAQSQRTHILFIHHASKRVDQASIDAALGSTGIAGKPGTVLNYRLSDPQDPTSARILSCSKHRAGDPADLPAVVLEWDRGRQTVEIAGLATRLALEATGLAAIREIVRQPGIEQPALLAELIGSKKIRLEAIKALIDQRICRRAGRGVRSDPFTLSPAAMQPESAWRAYCRAAEHSGTFQVQAPPYLNSGISVSGTLGTSCTENVNAVAVSPIQVFGYTQPENLAVPESPDQAVPEIPEIPESDPDGMFARWQARKGER